MTKQTTLDSAEKELSQGFGEEKSPEDFIAWSDGQEKITFKCRNEGVTLKDLDRSRVFSKMIDEVLPIVAFLKRCHDYEIKSVIYNGHGSQNYDGSFTTSCGKTFYLEVTCAKDGELDFYRLSHMDQFRIVPLTASKKEIFAAIEEGKEASSEFILTEPAFNDSRSTIENRIEKKISKEYQPNTILLVVENERVFHNIEEMNSFADSIRIPEGAANFHEIYFVNSSEPICKRIYQVL